MWSGERPMLWLPVQVRRTIARGVCRLEKNCPRRKRRLSSSVRVMDAEGGNALQW
jgi:hypothetical protein